MSISWDGLSWIPSTAYVATQRAINVGNVYVCVTGGTSAASGGPTGIVSPITDGSVTWNYLGAYAGYYALGAAPELATGAPTTLMQQTMFLSLAETLAADPCAFIGGTLDPAQAYLAAAYGQLARLRGHGPITAEAVGALSRGYAALTGPFAISLTTAGLAYLDLVNGQPTMIGVNL